MEALLEAADALHRALVFQQRTEALQAARAEVEQAARFIFSQQAWDVLNAIYNVPLSEAKSDEDDTVEKIVAAIALALAARLGRDRGIITRSLREALARSIAATGLSKYGIKVSLDDIRAAQWLESHGAELVKGLNEWTTTQLRALLADGVTSGRSISAMAEEIVSKFQGMSYYRAETIALTETAKAYSYAEMQQAELMAQAGIPVMKQWLLSPLHDIYDPCDHNSEVGPVPYDSPFPTGDMASPQHPRCRCTTIAFPDPEATGKFGILGQTLAIGVTIDYGTSEGPR